MQVVQKMTGSFCRINRYSAQTPGDFRGELAPIQQCFEAWAWKLTGDDAWIMYGRGFNPLLGDLRKN